MTDERDIILRPKEKRIKFGHEGKRIYVVRNDKHRLVLPLAPLEEDIRQQLKCVKKDKGQPLASGLSRVSSTALESLEPVSRREFQQVCLAVKNEAFRAKELSSKPRQETQEAKATHALSPENNPGKADNAVTAKKHSLEFKQNAKKFQDPKERIRAAEKFTNQGKRLSDDKEYAGCDLTDQVELERLVSKLRHNLGNYQRETRGKHLRWRGVPKLCSGATKSHFGRSERKQINGARPLSRPAKFPRASAPFEVLVLVSRKGKSVIFDRRVTLLRDLAF